jgi:cellulose synthase/poly-beta-1,6-N-acetylglucosamine synthase-like glycosyltransferase
VALDYLCGYLVNMVGRDQAYSLPAYGGANCAVRASALREVGGWNEASVTEDTDLTVRLLLEGWRVAYDPEAIDVEQAVTTVPQFWRQRYRWARGHQQVCADYRLRALRSRQFAVSQKAETQLFLFAFHLPVLCLLAVCLVAFDAVVGLRGDQSVDLWPLIPLMLAGPILEIGGGMILARTRRLRALDLLLFPILYVISMGVCTKALVDRNVRRGYSWHKTERSDDLAVTR